MCTDRLNECIISALRAYSVGCVHAVLPVAGDHANRPHIVTTEAGRFFVKILSARIGSPLAVETRHTFVEHLKRQGLHVPSFIATDRGDPVFRDQSTVIEVQEYIPGAPLCADDARQATLVGEALANLHLLAATFGQIRGSFGAWTALIKAEIERIDQRERQMRAYLPAPEIAESLSPLRDVLLRMACSLNKANLPLGMIKGDLQPEDMLRDEKGRIWVTDFDECQPGPMVWDLLRLRASCGAEAVSAYIRRRPLSTAEEEWLQSSAVKEYMRHAIPAIR